MGNAPQKIIRKIYDFLLAPCSACSCAPSAFQQFEPVDMDDVDEIIRNDLERMNGNSTVTSSSSQPSLPSLPVQLSPETVQLSDRDREVVAPVASTSRACAGAASESRQDSNGATVEIVEQPSHMNSEVVAPVASTSRACAGAASESRQDSNGATVEIVEQPSHMNRFRYDCEISSAGAILGVRNTTEQKSFPKIKIGNYEGPAEITVSLVCKDEPYRVHPNSIVAKKKSSEEHSSYTYVKKVQVTRDKCVIQFQKLFIRRVTRDQIQGALRLRENQNFDPFGQGFSHKFDPRGDDVKAVRLCFQVKLAEEHELEPVVSDVIYHSRHKIFTSGCLRLIKVIPISSPASNTSGPKLSQQVVLRRPSDPEPGVSTYSADSDAIIKNKKRKRLNDEFQDYVKRRGTPPDSDSEEDQDWRKMPGPFDDNPTMPGPSSGNPAVPGPSSVNAAVSEMNHVNSAKPRPSHAIAAVAGPSTVDPAVPGPSSVNPDVSRPNSVNTAVSESDHDNSAMPRPSSVNPTTPGPSSVDADGVVPNYINSTMSEPGFVNSAVPGLNYVNRFLPEPSFARPMQTNLSMSPDIVPIMSVTEDEDFVVFE